MATQEVDRLMDNLRIVFAGAVDDTLKLEFYNAMNYFLPRSLAWVMEREITIIAEQKVYPLALPRGRIEQLLAVLDANSNPQRGWAMPSRTTIQAPYAPNTAGDVFTARFAMGIKLPVTREGYPDFPNEVLEQWFDTILAGTTAFLQKQPMKPWTNLPMAKVHWGFFTKGISEAKQRAAQMSTYSAAPWQFPRNFRV